MHELSLAGGVVSMVEAAAAHEHFQRVAQRNQPQMQLEAHQRVREP